MPQPTTDAHGPREIPITIDKEPVKAPKTPMTGLEIRQLAHPPVPSDKDLYLEEHGRGKDVLVGDTDPVDLKPGMHFYSAPKTVNPGSFADAVA